MKKNKQSAFEKELDKRLALAAKRVAKDLDTHFKKDGWPLRYGFYSEEVFYEAFGFHVEKYFLQELRKRKGKYVLRSSDKADTYLLIDLVKNKKNSKRNNKRLIKLEM